MRIPIGALLIEQGALTAEQCRAVLDRQQATHRPFGEIAEELFDVDAREVEKAWANQYASLTKWIDPLTAPIDPMVRDLVNRRQAWQFRLLPIGYDASELMVCTTLESLVRAMNFAVRQLPMTCYFVLATPENLAGALMRVYPMDGMEPTLITGESANWTLPARRAC